MGWLSTLQVPVLIGIVAGVAPGVLAPGPMAATVGGKQPSTARALTRPAYGPASRGPPAVPEFAASVPVGVGWDERAAQAAAKR
jgi:hypothetical protein